MISSVFFVEFGVLPRIFPHLIMRCHGGALWKEVILRPLRRYDYCVAFPCFSWHFHFATQFSPFNHAMPRRSPLEAYNNKVSWAERGATRHARTREVIIVRGSGGSENTP